MKEKEKKDSNYGILVLFLILIGALCFFFYYQIVNKQNDEEEKEEQASRVITDEEMQQFIDYIHLTYEEESVMTKEDIEGMEEGLKVANFSNKLKISYGIKNHDKKDYGTEDNYVNKPIKDASGYVYSGKYIKASFVQDQLDHITGPMKYTNETINLPNIKYIYVSNLDAYRLYEKEVTNPLKVTYYSSKYDDDHIYITEYVAYTVEDNEGFKTSYTRHQELLPIGITEGNIEENLDLVDKYLYTFDYNVNVNRYFLSEIKYLKE